MNTRHKAVQAGSKLENEINFIKKDRKRKRIFDVDAQDSSTFDLKGPLCSFTHTDRYLRFNTRIVGDSLPVGNTRQVFTRSMI